MRLSLLLAPLALAACSTPADNSANVAADDVANASAFQPMEPLDPPAPGTPGGLPDDRTPISEGSFTPDSAQGAGQVVQTYYALLEKGDFRQAWELWADHGAASGMSSADFAASFGKYSEYHANIGAPGEINAGAGQRYVTIPVQVYGRLKEGAKPFYMIGTMTLHRTEVDGASAEQRKWRIRSTDIKPRPGDAAAGRQPGDEDNRSTARYRCIDGSKIAVSYDPDNGTATVVRAGKRLAVLKQERVASGIAYAGGGYALRGKGDDMDFTAPDLPPLPCTAIR
jgi:membrane-bound inhibitor of C-type lysozyme